MPHKANICSVQRVCSKFQELKLLGSRGVGKTRDIRGVVAPSQTPHPSSHLLPGAILHCCADYEWADLTATMRPYLQMDTTDTCRTNGQSIDFPSGQYRVGNFPGRDSTLEWINGYWTRRTARLKLAEIGVLKTAQIKAWLIACIAELINWLHRETLIGGEFQ